MKGIKQLVITDNEFSVPSADRIARAMAMDTFSQLEVLDLSASFLREKSVNIANGLIGSKIKLRCLYLQDNSMELDGAEAIAQYLETIDSLEELDISRN